MLGNVSDPAEREWYVRATIEHGWSPNILVHQIESGLRRRVGEATTNFGTTLSAPQSDLALHTQGTFFDFLSLGAEARERDLEPAGP